MLPYNHVVAEKRKERKEEPKKQAEHLRETGKKAELACSYAPRWFSDHPEYADVLDDPEKEAQKASSLSGPACGLRRVSRDK